MRIRTFRAPDLRSAMDAVRRTLGEDGLILQTRENGAFVEILAASDDDRERRPGERTMPEPLAIVSPNGSAAARLRTALEANGLSLPLVERLLDAGDDLEFGLGRLLRFEALPLDPDGPPLMFAGEPGAGKTLSVLKAATRLVLGGRPPLVISTDGRKAGAIEQLASMTRLLGLTLLAVRDAEQLRRAVARRKDGAPVLIDTPGLDIFSSADRAFLGELRDAGSGHVVLVMPAGLDVADASDLAAGHASFGTSLMIASRLDMARRIGGIVEPAFRSGLALTEAGTGPDVARDLLPVTPRLLATRLRGPTRRLAEAEPGPRLHTNPEECPDDGRHW